MIALAVFVISLLLALETLDPTGGWLVTLAVLSGIGMFSGGGVGIVHVWMPVPIGRQNRFAAAVTVFVIALLLVIGTIEPDPPWLVTLAVLSGILAFLPKTGGWRWGRRLRARVRGSWGDEEDW